MANKFRYAALAVLSVAVIINMEQAAKMIPAYFGSSRAANETEDESPGFLSSIKKFSPPPYTYFILLCLQCGSQPILVKLFMPTNVIRSTCVIAQEGVKFAVSLFFLVFSGNFASATESWTPKNAVLAAGVPATLFAIQNYANLMANQVLPPVTFSVMNQTKILSTAWCVYLLMGKKQTNLQVVALMMLVFATLIIQKIVPLDCYGQPVLVVEDDKIKKEQETEKNTKDDNNDIEKPLLDKEDSSKDLSKEATGETTAEKKLSPEEEAARQLTMGVLPALLASFLSGLAGTLTQKTLQLYHRSPHVFNMELAIFSSSFLFLTLLLGSPDYKKIKEGGISQGWTWKTWIPITSNAFGGVLVGLVTLHQGAVVKGFAMIFGMAIIGVLQQIVFGSEGGGVTREQFLGGCIGAFSLWMHSNYRAD